MNLIMQYFQDFLTIVGGLYLILSTLGAVFSNTAFGKWCRTVAADLQTILTKAPPGLTPPPPPAAPSEKP
jgi:hypothetical protein